jgi:hypothetical protein
MVLVSLSVQNQVGREVILDSLFFPMRELSRPMGMVPAYNFLDTLTFGFLKRVPIQGMDTVTRVRKTLFVEILREENIKQEQGGQPLAKLIQIR